MKTLFFAFTGVVTFLLITQLLQARYYGEQTPFDSANNPQEVEFAPPNRGFPATTLPSGTR
jgi:hypothetical protein